ncbi:unnamed protein product [Closterium sp. NIES-53]
MHSRLLVSSLSRGGEFSSDLLAEFCQDEGIHHFFTLPASPQQNGIAERRIGLIMEVARTSMIHAAAPHFPFAIRYAAHQLNLWPHVSESETSPTLRWTGKVGDASVFWSPPPVDPLPPQGPAPSAEAGDPAADNTAATRRSPRLETPPGFPPRPSSPPPQPAAVDFGAETAGVEPGGAEIEGEGSGGAVTGGAGSWGAASPSGGGAVGDPAGGPGAGQPPQPDLLEMLSPQAIRAWIVRRGSPDGGGYGPASAGAASPGGTAGAGGTGGTAGGVGGAAGAGDTRGAADAGGARATSRRGATGAGGAEPTSSGDTAGAGGAGGAAGAGGVGAGGTGGAGAASPGGARIGGAEAARVGGAVSAGGVGGTRAAGTGGAGATGAGAAGAAGPGGARTRVTGAAGVGGAASAGGATRAAGTGGAGGTAGARGAGARGATGAGGAGGAVAAGAGGAVAAGAGGAGASQPQLLPGSPLPTPIPHTEVTESLTKRREPKTRASTPVCSRRVARPRPLAVPSTLGIVLRSSSVPQRVVLLEPPASSLPHITDPESNLTCIASPNVTCLLATVVTDPDLESTAAFALVTELVDFVARSCLDYVANLVTESESVRPPSVGGEPALSSDVLEDRQFELECLVTVLPRFASMLLCPEGDLDALDIRTPRSYAEAIVGEYSSQWQTAMDTEMASWKSTGTYIDEVPPPRANIVDGMWIFRGVEFFQTFSPTSKMTTHRVLLHIAAQRDYELHSLDFSTAFLQGSHEEIWLRCPPDFTGSFPAGTQWSLLRPVYGLRQAPREWHDTLRTTLAGLRFAPSSADRRSPTSIESVEPSGPYPELVGCLICEAEIYAGAMATQELRLLTYLLTELGERPRSPILYVDNKAMLALCHDQRLEHRTKPIALCYFFARELQQRRQLCLSYVASRANTADVFTKTFGSGDHQHFCTALGLVHTLLHLLVA